jgi:hypothetical protein
VHFKGCILIFDTDRVLSWPSPDFNRSFYVLTYALSSEGSTEFDLFEGLIAFSYGLDWASRQLEVVYVLYFDLNRSGFVLND